MRKLAVVSLLLISMSAWGQGAAKKDAAKAAAPAGGSGLEAKIRQGWQDFKDHKKDAFGAVQADDVTQVWADNKPPRGKAAIMKDMDAWTLDSFTLSSMKITSLGADAAMATYQAKVAGTAAGQKFNETLAVTEVWSKQGSDWKCRRYHESEIK